MIFDGGQKGHDLEGNDEFGLPDDEKNEKLEEDW